MQTFSDFLTENSLTADEYRARGYLPYQRFIDDADTLARVYSSSRRWDELDGDELFRAVSQAAARLEAIYRVEHVINRSPGEYTGDWWWWAIQQYLSGEGTPVSAQELMDAIADVYGGYGSPAAACKQHMLDKG